MSLETTTEELTAMADTKVSPQDRVDATFAEAANLNIANAPSAEEKPNTPQQDVDPDDGYLAHIVYQPDVRNLTDHDLVDCLRGSANASCFGRSSPEVLEEQITLIAELQARSFTTKAIVGIMIVGAEEGRRQHQRRVAKQIAAGNAAASSATGHSGKKQ